MSLVGQRVLVCGGREYNNDRNIAEVLDDVHRLRGIGTILTGAQRKWSESELRFIGADYLAIQWAWKREIPFIGVPASWAIEGKSAGPKRNLTMATDWNPTLGVAFSGGPGTADMVRILRSRGIEVIHG